MGTYILRRLFYAVPTLFVIVTASFFGMRAAPGGPFDSERPLPVQVKANIEHYYGLDQPLAQQYANYLLKVLHGDLGPSFRYPDRTVNEQIVGNAPTSVVLGLTALLFALLVGMPAGLVGALNQNRPPDYLALSVALFGASIPAFVIGPLLMLIFAIRLDWLPVAGWGDPAHLILPAIALGLAPAAFVARLTRAGTLEVIRQDFVRTARAKGLHESAVLGRHILKLSLLPLVSYLGPASAALLTGSIVVERIFQVPGIGRYFIESALNRDYSMVMGTVIVYSVLLILLNLLVDVFYAFLDPRIRYS
jgi:oligopeptide transport system permease protein